MINYTDSYAKNCKLARPHLPKGCRFLKLGETIPEGARIVHDDGYIEDSFWIGVNVREFNPPIFVKIPAWRTNPLDVVHKCLPTMDLRRETVDGIVADFIKTVSDEKTFRAYLRAAKKGLTEADFD